MAKSYTKQDVCDEILFLMHWNKEVKLTIDEQERLDIFAKSLLDLNNKVVYPLDEYNTDRLRFIFWIDWVDIKNKYSKKNIDLSIVEWDLTKCLDMVRLYIYYPEMLKQQKTRARL